MFAWSATVLLAAGLSRGDTAPDGHEALIRTLDVAGAGTVVAFYETKAGRQPTVALATKVNASADTLRGVLADPAAYRRAIPAFVKAEIIRTEPVTAKPATRAAMKPGEAATATVAAAAVRTLVAWELEIPLWNLKGKLWFTPNGTGMDLDFAEGDFSPGLFQLDVQQRAQDSVFVIEGHANVRDVNWLTRRLVARHPRMESAMTATAAWILLQALGFEAESPRAAPTPNPRRRPTTPVGAPSLAKLDVGTLAAAIGANFDEHTAVAFVRSRPDGRLDHIELGATLSRPAEITRARIAEGSTWRALPGWKTVTTNARETVVDWKVDANLAFVDLDAIWTLSLGPPLRGQSRGDWAGAALGWDVFPGATAAKSVAVFSLHPRLDKAGYLPRKFIEAEPLMEHGLALGLAYVDALALLKAIDKPAPPPPAQRR